MATITGTAANNTLNGTIYGDIIYGKDGHDLIKGGDGADALYGDNGNDTIYGGNGNDTVKGGNGVSKLYGEGGDDKLYYNPIQGLIADKNVTTLPVMDQFAKSYINGGSGNDTLYLINETKWDAVTPWSPYSGSQTKIEVTDAGGEIFYGEFEMDNMSTSMGKFASIERLDVVGKGRLEYDASTTTKASNVLGTAYHDQFQGGSGNDRFDGRGGDDIYHGGGGSDTLISTETDADTFVFDVKDKGSDTVIGFNGEGREGGDMLWFIDGYDGQVNLKITEVNGHTKFSYLNDSGATSTVDVDAVGLVANIDYFTNDFYYLF